MEPLKINEILFPRGKSKALTLSYDEGVLQDRKFVAYINQYGVKGTFNLNKETFGTHEMLELGERKIDVSKIGVEEVASMYEGHEVAICTSHHTSLMSSGREAVAEIYENRKALEILVNYLVQGHTYPFGFYDSAVIEMLKVCGIKYARTTASTGRFDLPENFLEWNPTCHHNDDNLMELIHKFCEADTSLTGLQLFYLWGRSYEFDIEDNWAKLDNFLKYISNYKEQIWMASNMDIVNYVTAFRNLILSADEKRIFNPSLSSVWIRIGNVDFEIPSGNTISIV